MLLCFIEKMWLIKRISSTLQNYDLLLKSVIMGSVDNDQYGCITIMWFKHNCQLTNMSIYIVHNSRRCILVMIWVRLVGMIVMCFSTVFRCTLRGIDFRDLIDDIMTVLLQYKMCVVGQVHILLLSQLILMEKRTKQTLKYE